MFFDGDMDVQQQSFSNPAQGLTALQQEFRNTGALRNRSAGGADYSHLRRGEKSATQSRIK
jgi:hypothetical protein